MKKFLFTMVDRIMAVLGAFIFCQIPSFMQQYTQLLLGHLEECKRLLATIEHNASQSNKTILEYIQKFLTQQDPDFVNTGLLLQNIQQRSIELSTSYSNLQQASLWKKPFVFLSQLDSGIFKETYSGFVPALSFSLETIVYALFGMVFAIMMLRLASWGCRSIFRSKKPA